MRRILRNLAILVAAASLASPISGLPQEPQGPNLFVPGSWAVNLDGEQIYCTSRDIYLKLEPIGGGPGSSGEPNLPPAPDESQFNAPISSCDISWGHWKPGEELLPSDLEKIAEEGRRGTLYTENNSKIHYFGRRAPNVREIRKAKYSNRSLSNIEEGSYIGIVTSEGNTVVYQVYFIPLISKDGKWVIPDYSLFMIEILRYEKGLTSR